MLKIASVLWVIWGAVHVLAGVIVLSSDASGGFQAIADAVDPATLQAAYAPAVGGVLHQHGWNLAWFGLATLIGAIFIWRKSMTAIWVTAMVGGLADVGYFIFLDIPGHVNFVPGTLMTFVSGSAIVLTFWVWMTGRKTAGA
ncbi:MAG: hypothetical protein AAF337_00930 [Pseudomonadota bacterium]